MLSLPRARPHQLGGTRLLPFTAEPMVQTISLQRGVRCDERMDAVPAPLEPQDFEPAALKSSCRHCKLINSLTRRPVPVGK
jgi:hypothetical protein